MRKNGLFGREMARNIALITQVGLMMMVPMFMCVFLGIMLDKVFSTKWITIVLLVLGILAGMRNTYLLIVKSQKQDERDREQKK